MVRDYGQYCALARAVEVVGERWTPLLVRELATGPKRFSDLEDGLPGIGSALLTGRLRRLEGEGIIEKAYLAPPSDRTVYQLTADGRDLMSALAPLAEWGARRLGRRRRDEMFRIEWFLLLFRCKLEALGPVDLDGTFEVHLDGQPFHMFADGGTIAALEGPAEGPVDVVVRCRIDTFAAIATGRLDAETALADERVTVEGDVRAFRRMLTTLGIRTTAASL